MKLTEKGLEVRIVSEPRVIATRTGKSMVSLFSIFHPRRKNEGGGWDDDPRYNDLRISMIAFGEVADRIIADGIGKGSVIAIREGVIGKPVRDFSDVEVRIYDYSVVMGKKVAAPTDAEPVSSSEVDLPF